VVSEVVAAVAFDATVVTPTRGPGALVVLPLEAAAIFGTRARVPVRATFNGVAYRGSAMPIGDGRFGLGLTKAIRVAAAVEVGDTVHVVVERDPGERTVDVPDDLAAALEAAGLAARFAGLAYTHRKEYVGWITSAKKAETRAGRVTKAITMVRQGQALS